MASMIDDLRHFRAVVEECRDDEPLMSRLAASLGMTAIVMLSITCLWLAKGNAIAAPQTQSSSIGSPAQEPAGAASNLAAIVAACMRGEQFIWMDPHTGADMAAFCDVEVLGRVGR